jgi:alpha-L-fucosidase 2
MECAARQGADLRETIYRGAVGLTMLLVLTGPAVCGAQESVAPRMNKHDVEWTSLGRDFHDSMPIGNGDMGANVWTESNGDVVLLLGKTDAFTENGELVKLGRVRLHTTPSLFGGRKFVQVLHVGQGEVEIRDGGSGTEMRLWVDANHPVIRVEWHSSQRAKLKASVELWRVQPRVTRQGGAELSGRGGLRELNGLPAHEVVIDADTVLEPLHDELIWGHHNARSVYPMVLENQHLSALLEKYPDPLLNRTFGVAMRGAGMVSAAPLTLETAGQVTGGSLDLYELTSQAASMSDWAGAMEKLVARESAVDRETARAAHIAWWQAFWDRSWIEVSGSDAAAEVSQGYAMQRYMDAAGGRGAIPIKYNGSIFTVGQEPMSGTYDQAKGERDADYRDWGSNFWLQNTRLLYWPLIASGDYDLLAPFFRMYRDDLQLEKDRNELYFHQPGASYPETMYFWGTPGSGDFGWGNPGVVMTNHWIRYYVDGGLEVTAMMLAEYGNTGDRQFLKETLLPVADAVTTYYANHWPRVEGKLRMNPAQAIETRQQAVNPTPDLAGLMDVLPRLLDLPQDATTVEQRANWKDLLAALPPIPVGRTAANGKIPEMGQEAADGKPIILPAESYSKPNNSENAELYAVFPYDLYGVGLPDLQLARNTFAARLFKGSTCWGQDGMDAATLGLAGSAQEEAIANFTAFGGERFKWFWKAGHDWEPDMDNGGAGMITLQRMLLQTRGDKMLLFPAWPKAWDVTFKLYGPTDTIVQGAVKNGRVVGLTITPPSRMKDMEVLPLQ